MSALKLDHVFIITGSPVSAAKRFVDLGMVEGSSNSHPGQGTANRRFFMDGFTIELLYISDADEAAQGSGKRLGILQRSLAPDASPFGLVTRVQDPASTPSFPAWHYQPDYFPEGRFFYVCNNSDVLTEPLCICMPPALPEMPAIPEGMANPGWQLTHLEMTLPECELGEALSAFVNSCQPRETCQIQLHTENQPGSLLSAGSMHHLHMRFNNGSRGKQESLLPELPVSVAW